MVRRSDYGSLPTIVIQAGYVPLVRGGVCDSSQFNRYLKEQDEHRLAMDSVTVGIFSSSLMFFVYACFILFRFFVPLFKLIFIPLPNPQPPVTL